jgi:malonate-semialdehyde dehydrogenase (acetylating)/methylmalonate-semialdehyde dehydrogenase
VVEFACGIAQLLKGEFTANASTAVDARSRGAALGPVAIVSPFNL